VGSSCLTTGTADIRPFSTGTDVHTTTIRAAQVSQTRAQAVGRYTVSTIDPQQPVTKQPPVPSIQDIFGDTPPLRSAEDLAQDGIFADG